MEGRVESGCGEAWKVPSTEMISRAPGTAVLNKRLCALDSMIYGVHDLETKAFFSVSQEIVRVSGFKCPAESK